MRKDIQEAPLALDKFRRLFASSPIKALQFVRDNGYSIEPTLVPAALAEQFHATLERDGEQKAEALLALTPNGRARFREEQDAIKLALELGEHEEHERAGRAPPPLLARTADEKIGVILSGAHGLPSASAARAALAKIEASEEHVRAFESRFGAQLALEARERERTFVAREKRHQEARDAWRGALDLETPRQRFQAEMGSAAQDVARRFNGVDSEAARAELARLREEAAARFNAAEASARTVARGALERAGYSVDDLNAPVREEQSAQ